MGNFLLNQVILAIITCLGIINHKINPILAQIELKHMNVQVINKIKDEGKGSKLYLHCKSRDDDLGMQQLLRGQHLQWHFGVNFWMTTLYFCHFYWREQNRSFVVFKAGDEDAWCDHWVFWEVRNNGFYLTCDASKASSWVKMHNWDG
ncbi:hypothetical protein RND81_05G101300 [Saponaria officinalis]|uniref:S-protein homolog n=1 Tax=Saponaria officinalis TaxID=3572 RepID=A0AAW1KWD6_SAPOF